MARGFLSASSEYFNSSQVFNDNINLGASSVGLAISVWFYDTQGGSPVAANFFGMAKDADGGGKSFYLFQNASRNVAMTARNGGNAQATSTTTFSNNTWNHVFGIEKDNDQGRSVWLNGGGRGDNSTSKDFDGINRTLIGARHITSTVDLYYEGYLAEVAVWSYKSFGADDTARDAKAVEMATGLSSGYSPLFYPDGLQSYWPLVAGTGDALDRYKDANDLAENGTIDVQPHPRTFYPAPPMISFPTAAAGGGTVPPLAMHYYRRRRSA